MKTHQTIAGNNYVVYSKNGGTVTDASGTLNKTVAAGDFLFIPAAPSDMLMCDDDESVIKQANFKRAALALGLLGGGETSWLTALKRELSSLLDGASVQYRYSDSEKHLLILTDLSDDSLNDSVLAVCGELVPLGTTVEVFNLNKYAACKTLDDIKAVDLDYKNDLTSEGEWVYQLPEMTRADLFMMNNKKLEVFEQDLPKLTVGDAWFYMSGLKRFKGDISRVSSSTSMFAQTKIKYPEDFEANMAWLSWADNMFGGLEMSKELTLKIIDLLPVKTNPNIAKITLGISSEFKYDAELLEAIDRIDYTKTPVADGGKGWQVVIQWNGTASTASASTYRWGGRRDPVYAKLGKNSDGTPFLDWGHYVTDWEENGYMEFASLEEAREYFNIAE